MDFENITISRTHPRDHPGNFCGSRKIPDFNKLLISPNCNNCQDVNQHSMHQDWNFGRTYARKNLTYGRVDSRKESKPQATARRISSRFPHQVTFEEIWNGQKMRLVKAHLRASSDFFKCHPMWKAVRNTEFRLLSFLLSTLPSVFVNYQLNLI